MLKEPGARPALAWYAGAAAAAAAEQARRASRADAAVGAYGRAIALFERAAAADPALKDASDHGVALALAARARVGLEQGKDEAAAADVVAALARRPASAGTADGMSQKPGDTAHAVLARVKAAGRADLAAAIEAALAKVDPDLLIPD
jgi:hypothetical protein